MQILHLFELILLLVCTKVTGKLLEDTGFNTLCVDTKEQTMATLVISILFGICANEAVRFLRRLRREMYEH